MSGLGGEPFYSETFAEWSTALVNAAEQRLRVPRERIVHLSEDGGPDADSKSTRTAIGEAIERVAAAAEPGDTVFLVLVGHGTARGDRVLFNIPGPDLGASELDAMLAPHEDIRMGDRERLTLPVARSSSRSPGPNRIVITATTNAAERFHTRFAEHFVAAYAKPGADSDKNGRVSVLEAFTFATRETTRAYKEAGTSRASTRYWTTYGPDARAAPISRATGCSSRRTSRPEELERLLEERDDLEARITTLVADKSNRDDDDYDRRLEYLLVKFALVHRALRPAGATR